MMRPVWFGNRNAGAGIAVTPADMGQAPFMLVVQYGRTKTGGYKIAAKVRVRDAKVQALIDGHHLRETLITIDPARQAADKRQAELLAEMIVDADREGPIYPMAPWLWGWSLAKKAAVLVEQQRTVKVTFGSLLAGVEVVGTMAELRGLVWDISSKLDQLSASIEAGQSFDGGRVVVYSPGGKSKPKTKPDKPNVPPSEWSE